MPLLIEASYLKCISGRAQRTGFLDMMVEDASDEEIMDNLKQCKI